jgi:hypothetical protein
MQQHWLENVNIKEAPWKNYRRNEKKRSKLLDSISSSDDSSSDEDDRSSDSGSGSGRIGRNSVHL